MTTAMTVEELLEQRDVLEQYYVARSLHVRQINGLLDKARAAQGRSGRVRVADDKAQLAANLLTVQALERVLEQARKEQEDARVELVWLVNQLN